MKKIPVFIRDVGTDESKKQKMPYKLHCVQCGGIVAASDAEFSQKLKYVASLTPCSKCDPKNLGLNGSNLMVKKEIFY